MKEKFRRKPLYYDKYGFKIEFKYSQYQYKGYGRNNSQNNGATLYEDRRTLSKQFKNNKDCMVHSDSIYFKNESDYDKAIADDNRECILAIYRPADGYEDQLKADADKRLWYNRFPYKAKFTYKMGYQEFDDAVTWCRKNVEGPMHASRPNIFVMSRVDLLTIKLKYADVIIDSTQKHKDKDLEAALEANIQRAEEDLKIFLES